MQVSVEARQQAQALLDFIDHSPSPWHAVETVADQLKAHGFKKLRENEPWQFKQGGKYFVVRDGGSIIAFVLGQAPLADNGFRIVGAHTDSPGLRLKPKAAYSTEGLAQLGVEVYGGPILATFTDRDLSLAGRVVIQTAQGLESRLVRIDQAIARLPNLAIHMNREVNEKGLVLNKQTGLPLIFGHAANTDSAKQLLNETLAGKLAIPASAIVSWDLAFYDIQKGCFWGRTGVYCQ
jgi:aspartyl aminopeptidase